MRKRNHGQIVTIIGVALIFLGIIVSVFFDDLGSKIVTLATLLTTIIGAFAVYLQMRKGREVNQSEFLIEFSKFFYENEVVVATTNKFSSSIVTKGTPYLLKEEDMPGLTKLLNFYKTLASFKYQKILQIAAFDTMFSFEFFVVINNPYVQEREIVPFRQFYQEIFQLHADWIAYKKSNGDTDIVGSETDLSKLPCYKNVLAGDFVGGV